ncbi:MAG: YceI family protein [Chitinophagales bacterium]
MKKMLFMITLLAVAAGASAQTNWAIDASHTKIRFSVSHLMVSEVEGEFKKFSGKVVSKTDDFTDAVVEFSADIASVSTGDEKRDQHLQGDDFFNAEKYPTMTFKSVSFKKVSGNKYILEGDLTIRDVTKRVKLDVTYNGTKNAWGKTVAGFKATTVINRQDFNLKWDKVIESTPVVGNEVTITINLELNKQ